MFLSQADQAGSLLPLRIVAITLGAMALALSGLPTQAQAQQPTAVNVPYADLDLSQQVDVVALYERLQAAARHACDSNADLRNLRLQLLQQRCSEAALQRAVGQINHSSINAMYAASSRAATPRG